MLEGDTYSLGLEGVNSLELSLDIVGDGLEVVKNLLGLVDNVLVLENALVVGKVDGGGLLLELGESSSGVLVPLPESRDLGDGVLAQAKVGADLGKIDSGPGCHFE